MTTKFQAFARRLSWTKRIILLDHVAATKSTLRIPFGAAESHRLQAAKWLIMKGLLIRETNRTILSDDGRQVVSAILADCADILSRFGLETVGFPQHAPAPKPVVAEMSQPAQ
jgi:hypothetical protein